MPSRTRFKHRSTATALVSLACALSWRVAPLAAQTAEGPFTEAQSAAGQAVYQQSCAACHLATLGGAGEAPPLAGVKFAQSWSDRTTADLFALVKNGMPLGKPGSLSDEAYAQVVSFILQANGAKPGAALLKPDTKVAMKAIITGMIPAGLLARKPAAAPTDSGGRGGRRVAQPPTGVTLARKIEHYTPVTDAMLVRPPAGDWLMHLHDYRGTSFSSLNQITAENAKRLQLKWVWAMDESGRQQFNPLVHDGVMFVSNNLTNVVQALDAKTGDLLWENRLGPSLSFSANANRTMGLYGNLVIYPSSDAKLYALDARTGKTVWRTVVTELNGLIGGLNVINDKVLIGLTRCDERPVQEHCYIAAYDVNTGKQLWKFTTVALKGQPGGDSWNNLPDEQRSGGDAWISGTYDPALNLTYWGIGQAKPHTRDARGSGTGATDYTNSTVALDADTGQLKWYHNLAPGETLDLDEVFERVLVDYDGQKAYFTVGKTGILWKGDRQNGKYLGHAETVFQNVYTKIDSKTGAVTYRSDILKQEQWMSSCPSAEGGHNWQAMSHYAPADLLIIPLSQSCSLWGSGEKVFPMPGTGGKMGRLSAYEGRTLKPVWSYQQSASFLTSVVTTAGGLAFVGDFDRNFWAINAQTGERLWKARLGTTAQGFPVTFMVDGKQFVAVPTGTEGGSPVKKPMLLVENRTIFRPHSGQAVYVFALPDE